jgi:hypothetical protein
MFDPVMLAQRLQDWRGGSSKSRRTIADESKKA